MRRPHRGCCTPTQAVCSPCRCFWIFKNTVSTAAQWEVVQKISKLIACDITPHTKDILSTGQRTKADGNESQRKWILAQFSDVWCLLSVLQTTPAEWSLLDPMQSTCVMEPKYETTTSAPHLKRRGGQWKVYACSRACNSPPGQQHPLSSAEHFQETEIIRRVVAGYMADRTPLKNFRYVPFVPKTTIGPRQFSSSQNL